MSDGAASNNSDYRDTPKKVEEIECRVYNWESMRCNWTLGVTYKHPERINVSLNWTKDLVIYQRCPALTETSCTWPRGQYTHSFVYFIIVTVRVLTQSGGQPLRSAQSPIFQIDTKTYATSSTKHQSPTRKCIARLEPAPIRSFMASKENSTCIGLSWNHSSSPRRRKFFIGEYKNQDSPHAAWIRVNIKAIIVAQEKGWCALVCGLSPFTDYTFRIAVLPYAELSSAMTTHGYQSKWAFIERRTEEDVPGSSPPMCNSCFHVQACESTRHDNSGCRVVRIYWKEILMGKRNGRVTSYYINFRYNQTIVKDFNVTARVKSLLHEIDDLKYKISLKAATVKGPSVNSSILTIPAKFDRPPPPKHLLIVKETPFFYSLRWTMQRSSSHKYKNTTIVWCDKSPSPFTCKGEIQWTTLPATSVTYELELESDQNIMIGVAAEAMVAGSHASNVLSSGIEWSTCVYLRNQTPKNPPLNVGLSFEKHEHYQITIRWTRIRCPLEMAYVTKYYVLLCTTIDSTTCHEAPLNMTTDRVSATFVNLQPDKKYMASVRAMSDKGIGPPSLPVVTVLKLNKKDRGLKTSLVVAFGVVTAIFLLFVFCVIWMCVRYCQHRKEKIIKMKILLEPCERKTQGQSLKHQSNHFLDGLLLPSPPRDERLFKLDCTSEQLVNENSLSSRTYIKASDTFYEMKWKEREFFQKENIIKSSENQNEEYLPSICIESSTLKKSSPIYDTFQYRDTLDSNPQRYSTSIDSDSCGNSMPDYFIITDLNEIKERSCSNIPTPVVPNNKVEIHRSIVSKRKILISTDNLKKEETCMDLEHTKNLS